MRILVAMLLALALALPAAAVADSSPAGSSSTSTQQTAKQSKKKNKKKNKKKRTQQGKKGKRSGAAGTLEISGAVTALDPVTVGAVSCVVPGGKTITGIVVGDIVEMRCTLVGGVWTLRRLKLDDDADETGSLEVKGAVQALSPLTVNGVACVVPATGSLGSLAVGDIVEMTCRQVNGVWTVSRVKVEDTAGDDDNDSATADDDDNDGKNCGSGGGDDRDRSGRDEGDRSGDGGGDDD